MVYAYADGSWNFDDQLNTGVCGIGVVIYNDNKKLGSFGKSFLGVENSQTAEAKAVMCALTYYIACRTSTGKSPCSMIRFSQIIC